MFLLNYNFLKISYFEKIGSTDGRTDGRTDGLGATLNSALYREGRIINLHHSYTSTYFYVDKNLNEVVKVYFKFIAIGR